jgi:hypothetical protein
MDGDEIGNWMMAVNALSVRSRKLSNGGLSSIG